MTQNEFDLYTSKNCQLVSEFKGNSLALNHPPTFNPPDGSNHFVQLDDPTVENGLRPLRFPPIAVDMREYFGLDGPEGDRFENFGKDLDIPTDGAVFSRNISVTSGQVISFLWSFFGFDNQPSNDFALFFCEDETGNVVYEARLCDIFTLRRMPGFTNHTDWAPHEYIFRESFSGTVYWVMANAVRVRRRSPWNIPPAGLRNPSVLLLDNITIG